MTTTGTVTADSALWHYLRPNPGPVVVSFRRHVTDETIARGEMSFLAQYDTTSGQHSVGLQPGSRPFHQREYSDVSGDRDVTINVDRSTPGVLPSHVGFCHRDHCVLSARLRCFQRVLSGRAEDPGRNGKATAFSTRRITFSVTLTSLDPNGVLTSATGGQAGRARPRRQCPSQPRYRCSASG